MLAEHVVADVISVEPDFHRFHLRGPAHSAYLGNAHRHHIAHQSLVGMIGQQIPVPVGIHVQKAVLLIQLDAIRLLFAGERRVTSPSDEQCGLHQGRIGIEAVGVVHQHSTGNVIGRLVHILAVGGRADDFAGGRKGDIRVGLRSPPGGVSYLFVLLGQWHPFRSGVLAACPRRQQNRQQDRRNYEKASFHCLRIWQTASRSEGAAQKEGPLKCRECEIYIEHISTIDMAVCYDFVALRLA